MAYKRPNPVTCRFPVLELMALREIARAHGLTANIYVKRLIREHIVTSDLGQTVETHLDGYTAVPARSIVAPENRVSAPSQANRFGFADRLK